MLRFGTIIQCVLHAALGAGVILSPISLTAPCGVLFLSFLYFYYSVAVQYIAIRSIDDPSLLPVAPGGVPG